MMWVFLSAVSHGSLVGVGGLRRWRHCRCGGAQQTGTRQAGTPNSILPCPPCYHPFWLLQVMAASMIEDEVVKTKGLTLMDVEATRRLRARLRTPEAQGKAERLMDIVGTISHGRGPTMGARQLWARMSGSMHRLRRAAHALLASAEPDELNYILCTINAPAMVEVCSRTTMDLLTCERLPELATETRCGWAA